MIVRASFRQVAPEPAEVISAEARMLTLAYVVEQAVEDGHYRSAAEVAAALGLSRARLSQVMRARWSPILEQEAAIDGCLRQRQAT